MASQECNKWSRQNNVGQYGTQSFCDLHTETYTVMRGKHLVVSKFINEAVNISLEHVAFTTQTSQDRTAVPEMFPFPGWNDG